MPVDDIPDLQTQSENRQYELLAVALDVIGAGVVVRSLIDQKLKLGVVQRTHAFPDREMRANLDRNPDFVWMHIHAGRGDRTGREVSPFTQNIGTDPAPLVLGGHEPVPDRH